MQARYLALGLLVSSALMVLPRSVSQDAPMASASDAAWLASLEEAGTAKTAAPTPTFHKAKKAVAPKARNTLLAVVDQPDIRQQDKEIADRILRLFPEKCVRNIKNLYIRYDSPEQRGLAGKTTIIVDGSVPKPELAALLAHEAGHTVDLGCLVGTPDSGKSSFVDGKEVMYNNDPSVAFYRISWASTNVQNAGATPEDFVSGYAAWDPFEDVAETVSYYVFQQSAFRARAAVNPAIAAKLAWVETYVFPNGLSVATGEPWNNEVPWDTTKLSYVWLGTQKVALK